MLETQSPVERYLELAQRRDDLQMSLGEIDHELAEIKSVASAKIEEQLNRDLESLNSGICSQALMHTPAITGRSFDGTPQELGIYNLRALRLHWTKVSQRVKGGEPYLERLHLLCQQHYPTPDTYNSNWAIGRSVERADGRFRITGTDEFLPWGLVVHREVTPAIYRFFGLPVIEKSRENCTE